MKLLKISAFLILFLLLSCGDPEPEVVDENAPLPEQVDQLIKANEYESALSLLSEEDRGDPTVQQLLEKPT